MKKILAILLSFTLMSSLVACGKDDDKSSESSTSSSESQEETTETSSETVSIKDSKELLDTVWESYGDDEKFSASGGDTSEENMTMDGPGKYGIDDTAALDSTLGFPTDSGDKIDDAASLMHMMNANTFTCGAFHVSDSADITDLTTAIKDNIIQRQWICGFPDKLFIATIDDYIVSVFGENETVDTFKEKLIAAYPSAEIVSEEAIA